MLEGSAGVRLGLLSPTRQQPKLTSSRGLHISGQRDITLTLCKLVLVLIAIARL